MGEEGVDSRKRTSVGIRGDALSLVIPVKGCALEKRRQKPVFHARKKEASTEKKIKDIPCRKFALLEGSSPKKRKMRDAQEKVWGSLSEETQDGTRLGG